MRRLTALFLLTGLALVLMAAMARAGLAAFTDEATVTDNTLTSAACFKTCQSFGAVGDAYVKSDNPSANFGTTTSMIVDGNASKIRRALVQFDVSSISAGSVISVGTLTLCLSPGNNSPGHVHELRMVTSAWSEAGVIWTNQPSVSGTVTDSLTIPASDQCMSLDVTADVQAWVDGTTNYGWRHNDQDETGGGAKVDYWTREHGTAGLRPTLDVSYAPP